MDRSAEGAGTMKFGLYLKSKGVISADQLVAALEVQQSKMVPLGQLAIEEGILTARQVFTVLCSQSDSPHERFGEAAIDLGLMTRDELMRLLVIQMDRKLSPVDILIQQAGRRGVSRVPPIDGKPGPGDQAAGPRHAAEVGSNPLSGSPHRRAVRGGNLKSATSPRRWRDRGVRANS
jgi:hypothetical protein